MQLMPRTAGFVAGDWRFHRTASSLGTLYKPEINLMLGQKYIKILLSDKKINGDLFLMAAAWNGGPGNLNKWLSNTDHMDDPLFFIESIPSRETRIFIEKVLANLWIYRDRLGQPTPSLDAIAAGQWPIYKSLDNLPSLFAGNGTYASWKKATTGGRFVYSSDSTGSRVLIDRHCQAMNQWRKDKIVLANQMQKLLLGYWTSNPKLLLLTKSFTL